MNLIVLQGKLKQYIAALVIVISTTLGACSPDEDNGTKLLGVSTTTPYKVATYLSNGVNNTDSFAGYELQFGAGYQLQVSKNSIVSTGNWGQSGDSLTIRNFTTLPLSVLNKTWLIESNNGVELKLKNILGANINQLFLVRQ
jgi:cell division protein FtsW (lipid II flippase)